MSGRYAAYPEYKASEVAWLGQMPAHWGLLKTKRIFDRVQRPVRPEDGIVTAFRDGQVTLRSNRRMDGFTNAAKEIGYQGVRKGDLLVHAMDGFAGAIGVSDSDGKCSPVCSVCVPKETASLDVHYYGYLVRQLAVTDFITSLAKGIRERSTEFRFSEFAILPLTVPPLDEQTQIAKFLDYETAKIDALVAKQQQLIALLQEKRQAVISHAVTKGLNPAALLRDSGVAWLGQVPAHWEVIPIRYALNIDNGPRFPINRIERADMAGPYPYWGPTGILDYIDHYRYEGSRAIIGEDGDHFLKFAIWPMTHWATGKFNVNNHAHVIADGPKCSARWFYYSFLHRDIGGDVTAQGVARLKLTREALSKLVLAVPPLAEQKALIEHMEPIIVKVEKATVAAETQIELLQERRTALIAAAVTGKIDVRGWQPPVANAAAGFDEPHGAKATVLASDAG